MECNLVWFRNNLRISDNEPLTKAACENKPLICVYIFDPIFHETLPLTGLPKTGKFRTKFLLQSLENLQNSLRNLGNDLLIFRGYTAELIENLCIQYPVSGIYTTTEDTTEEKKIEEQIKIRLPSVKLNQFRTHTLLHPEDLPFTLSQLPDMFTRFRHAVEKNWKVSPPEQNLKNLPSTPTGLPETSFPDLNDFGFDDFNTDSRTAFPFMGGENQALERLKYYLWESRKISEYKLTRNDMIGADYSSKFSPWLTNGCLNARTIYHEIKAYEAEHGANESTYWLIFELLWRDYFRFVAMKYGNRIFQKNGIRQPKNPVQKSLFDHNEKESLMLWLNGKTSSDFCNANMKELIQTGFMSNRGRQNAASYLCKDLKVDWRMGAEVFESYLVDYDPCSNWGNWMYIAGVGNDPRQDRYFNLNKQAENYDPKGEFRRLWLNR